MDNKPRTAISLMQMELETLEEAREWGRRRLKEKLRKLSEEQGAISPPQRAAVAEGSPPNLEAADDGRRH